MFAALGSMDILNPIPPEPDAREEGASAPDGWDSIAALTGGEPPERFDELGRVRALEPVYPLLHALAGRGLREFFVRAAALEALIASERPAFGARDLDEILYFLDELARDATMKALRASGWLEHDPAEGTRITEAGRWAYDILAFLHKRVGEAELLPTVEGVEYALRIGIDPLRHLLSMRSRLTALRAAIDAARASHSEVILRRTAGRISDVMKLSEQIRAVLRRVPVENAPARAVAREVHDLLARLHGSGSELHRDVTEVGRQHLQLTGGVTNEQIVRALMRRSREELAAVGREALLPIARPPPLLTTDVVASAAEQQVHKDRPAPEVIDWSEPPEAPRASGDEGVPGEVAALLDELATIAREGRSVSLSNVVPRGSAAESFLRLSLLALAGVSRAGEGIAGRLGALEIDVQPHGDGWPEPLDGPPLARLTPGQIVPRARKGTEDG
jgi:hypothetical protein